MYVPSACKHGAHCRPHLAVVELRVRAAKLAVSPLVILHVVVVNDASRRLVSLIVVVQRLEMTVQQYHVSTTQCPQPV